MLKYMSVYGDVTHMLNLSPSLDVWGGRIDMNGAFSDTTLKWNGTVSSKEKSGKTKPAR